MSSNEPLMIVNTDNATEAVRVDPAGNLIISGNVGIGTSTPSAKLNIDPQGQGGIVIGNPNTGQGGFTSLLLDITAASGGHAQLQSIKSSGTEWGDIVLNPSGGNVGIGTDRPGALLEIASPSNDGVIPKLRLTDTASGGKCWEVQSGIAGVNDAYFGILNVTDNLQAVTITHQGLVGVGTTSPTQSLTLGAGNMQLPNAQLGTDGNLYFGGRTDAQETGMRLFGGLVNGNTPGGFIDVRTTDTSNGLRIRVDTNAGGSEKMRITPTGIQALVPISQPSDARTKTNIQQLDGALDKLACIRGISFEWSDAHMSSERPGQPNLGVIAQEIEAVFPELVSAYGDEGYKAVNYTGLTAVLIEAAKELKAENERLRQRIEVLEQKA